MFLLYRKRKFFTDASQLSIAGKAKFLGGWVCAIGDTRGIYNNQLHFRPF